MQELLELPQLARGSGGCAVKRKEGQLVGREGGGRRGKGVVAEEEMGQLNSDTTRARRRPAPPAPRTPPRS